MILEYHFGALLYDEQAHELHCAACGKPVDSAQRLYKAGGRWVCGGCLPSIGAPDESILCSTLKAAAEK